MTITAMMHKPLVFLLLPMVSTVVGNENSTKPDNTTLLSNSSTPYYSVPIYSVQYTISENKTPQLVLDLISQHPFNTLVTTKDLLNLLDSQNLIIPHGITSANLEKIITLGNMSINDILRNLTTYVPEKKSTNIRMILEGFNISFADYQDYVIENDDVGMLKLVKSGNYTIETAQYALSIINKTEAQFLAIVKPILFDGLANIPLSEVLKEFSTEVKHIFSNINITLSAVSQNDAFRKMLINFTDTLNNETFWSTAISANQLITVLTASYRIQPYIEYVDITYRNIENGSIYGKGSISHNESFSIITTKVNLESYIKKASDIPKNINGCYYIIQTNTGNLLVHNVTNATLQNNLIITENNYDLTHKLGSPLVCMDFLYGFLVNQNNTNLKFLALNPPNPIQVITPPGGSSVNGTTTHNNANQGHGQTGGTQKHSFNLILVTGVIIKSFMM